MNKLQLVQLHPQFDKLQNWYGEPSLKAIYGAGNINQPKFMFVFMNPTARNISSRLDWKGLRAPWIGIKQVWKLLYDLELLHKDIFEHTQKDITHWSVEFAEILYNDIRDHQIYITNFAKCTQLDAKNLSNSTFKKYRDLLIEEIELVNAKNIITFGNQCSSILIDKNVSVSNYKLDEFEIFTIKNKNYKIFPVWYPVGTGSMNKHKAIARLKAIL